MKTLTISEAMAALGNGKRVASDGLSKDTVYLKIIGNRITDIENDQREYSVIKLLLAGDNLRIYEKPKWYEDESNFPAFVHNSVSWNMAMSYCDGKLYYKNGKFDVINECSVMTTSERDSMYFHDVE